jgi:hypothetical protein
MEAFPSATFPLATFPSATVPLAAIVAKYSLSWELDLN